MKKATLAGILLLLIVSIIYSTYKQVESSDSQKQNPLLTNVIRRDFTIDINLVGVLDAAQAHMIASELEGTHGTIIYLTEDGARVKKGDILVRFDQAPFEKDVAKYQAEVESYQAAIQAAKQVVAFEANQVQREIANAEYRHRVATLELKRLQEGDGPLKLSMLEQEKQKALIELNRYKSFLSDLNKLKKDGYDNPSEITTTKERVVVLREKLAAVSQRYISYKKHVFPALIEGAKAKQQNALLLHQQTKQGGKHKIAKANAALLQVKGILKSKQTSLDRARFELDKTVIQAPFDGIVIHYKTFRHGQNRKPREGDSVFMNQPILYLPDITKMVVNTKAREVDLHKIKLGQKGLITIDAYPDAALTGELTFIGALATQEESSKSHEKFFQVTFKVNEQDKRLRPGMTCRITVKAESLKNVISVPVQAVFFENQRFFCFVKLKGGSFQKRFITIGRQNEHFVEITDGLDIDERVSMSRPSQHTEK